MPKPTEYSNVPLPSADEEMARPTPHEMKVSDLANKFAKTEPKKYDITSKNAQAKRIVHDVNRVAIVIEPGETKRGVMLWPNIAAYLGRGDLTVTAV